LNSQEETGKLLYRCVARIVAVDVILEAGTITMTGQVGEGDHAAAAQDVLVARAVTVVDVAIVTVTDLTVAPAVDPSRDAPQHHNLVRKVDRKVGKTDPITVRGVEVVIQSRGVRLRCERDMRLE
jgi:hypothetical protein